MYKERWSCVCVCLYVLHSRKNAKRNAKNWYAKLFTNLFGIKLFTIVAPTLAYFYPKFQAVIER